MKISTRLFATVAMGLGVSAAVVAQNYPDKIWAMGNLHDIPVNGWEFCETYPLQHQGNGIYKGIVKMADNTNTYRPGEGDEPMEYPWGKPSQKWGNRADLWFVSANWQEKEHIQWCAVSDATYEGRWVFPGRTLKLQKYDAGAGAGPNKQLQCLGGTYEFVLDAKNLTLTTTEVADDPLPWLPLIWCYGHVAGNEVNDPFRCGPDDFRVEFPHQGNGLYGGQLRMRDNGIDDRGGVLAIKHTSPLASYDGDGFITYTGEPSEAPYDGEEHDITVCSGYRCFRFLQSGLYNFEVDMYNGKINITEEFEDPEMIYVAGTFEATDEEDLDVILENSLAKGVTLKYNEDEALYMGTVEVVAAPAVKGDREDIPENSAALLFSINGDSWDAFREGRMGPKAGAPKWIEMTDGTADCDAHYSLGTYALAPGKYDVVLDHTAKAVTFTAASGGVSNVAADMTEATVTVANGVITVAGADDVKVFTIGGALVSEGKSRVNVSTGVYMVVADGSASKVVVK